MSISVKKRPRKRLSKKPYSGTMSVKEQERVRIAANSFCLHNYAVGFTGGVPRRLDIPSGEIFVVPVLFTSPGFGVVGEVGVLAVDPLTFAVVGATPVSEVRAAGARLARENRLELDAAFRRARTI
jgi:hypothetical protein